jgi:hypothetical protein
LATCGKTQNDVLLELYRVTPLLAIWEIQLVRRGPGYPTPNCLLLAEAVDAAHQAHTSFTIVPYRHTYPDVASQMAWNWCCNFFMAWRWAHYKQVLPFPLNEHGNFQYTRDQELREYLERSPLTEEQFKQQRRLDYYGILRGDQLEERLAGDWLRYRSSYDERMNQARAELEARGRGEEITFQAAAAELIELLRQPMVNAS